MDPKQLAAQIGPIADQLRQVTEPYTGDDSLPAAQQLLPIAGEIAVLAGYILGTAGDSYGTGRANLESMQSLATRLMQVTEKALQEEPPHPSPWG